METSQLSLVTGIVMALVSICIPGSICTSFYRNVYYVQPTTESGLILPSLCPGQPCFNLGYYLQHQEQFFTSNTKFVFMEGVHMLMIRRLLIDNTVVIGNIRNLALIGSTSLAKQNVTIESQHFTHVNPTTEIICDQRWPSALVFIDIDKLTVSNIKFTGCGRHFREGIWDRAKAGLLRGFFPKDKLRPPAALFLSKVGDLTIQNTLIQNSTGYGLLGINVNGNSYVSGSAFLHNNNNLHNETEGIPEGGNALLIYINSGKICQLESLNQRITTVHVDLHVTHSQLLFGLGRGYPPAISNEASALESFLGGGGLTIMLTPTDFKVSINISDTVAAYNSALFKADGTNMWIVVHQRVNSFCVLFQNVTSLFGISALGSQDLTNSVGFSAAEFRTSGCEASDENDIFKSLTFLDSNFMHNSVALNVIVDSATTLVTVIIDNCTYSKNEVHLRLAKYETLFHDKIVSMTKGVTIFIKNSSFSNSTVKGHWTPSISIQYFHVHFRGCQFQNNFGTAINAINSVVFFYGNNSFYNNTGYNGGAIALLDDSYISSRSWLVGINNNLTFYNNHALHSGGAVYVNNEKEQQLVRLKRQKCSFVMSSAKTQDMYTAPISFYKNTARIAGSALYGVLLDNCILGVTNFEKLFNVVPSSENDMSVIASDPTHIVKCQNKKIVVSNTSLEVQLHVYPGETFTIELGATGRGGGLSPAAINSTLINTNASLGPLQQIQEVNSTCKNLTYNIFTNEVGYFEELEVKVSDYAYYMNGIEGGQLTASIFVKECPAGFELSTDGTPSCVCENIFKSLKSNVTCDISHQTFTRTGTVWIHGYPVFANSSEEFTGVIVHAHCPFDYCNQSSVTFTLSNPDKQCSYGRYGILCGTCRRGLSLTLGSSQCAICSNKYLALLLPFSIFGLVLVILLTTLNFTVSVGALNGLIFYANVVQFNRVAFFPPDDTRIGPLRTILIAWINLDFGITSCFYNSMDMYAFTWLEFVFPVYVWVIVGALIFFSRRYLLLVKLLGNNAIKVLATLFLLSYTKLIRTIATILSFTIVHYPNGESEKRWIHDGNIAFARGKHIPLAMAALAFTLLFIVPYTLLLLLTPCLHANSNRRFLKWVNKLMPFLDAYQGPYKFKYRNWTGLMLLVRLILFVTFTLSNGDVSVNLLSTSIVIACLLAVNYYTGPVYRNKIISTFELFFLQNLLILSIASLFALSNSTDTRQQTKITCTMITCAFCTFNGICVYHLYLKINKMGKLKCLKRKTESQRKDQDTVLMEVSHKSNYELPTVTEVSINPENELLTEPLLTEEASTMSCTETESTTQ